MRLLTSSRRWAPKRLIVVAAAALGAAALAAPAAQADFTITSCHGAASGVFGNGSTLQNGAQKSWWAGSLAGEFGSADGCPGKAVSYNPSANTGSGAGRKAFGALDGVRTGTNNPDNSRFVGSDEPLTPGQEALVNGGSAATTADDGAVHTIPVAATSIAAVVNIPADCVGQGTNRVSQNGGTAGDDRLQITDQDLEKVFAGTFTTWGQIVAGATGNCVTDPIHRIVRNGDSGSTYAFKSFLNLVAPGTFSVAQNQQWPSGGSATLVAASGHLCTGNLCAPSSGTGGGDLRGLLNDTPGGIGYLALSDARTGYDYDGGGDTTYWLPIQKLDASGYIEPTADASGWKSTKWVDGTGVGGTAHLSDTKGLLGASCNGITPAGIPANADPTLGDWTPVDATGGTGYPACTLTYDLVFDDNAPIWGNNDTEQGIARTVKDYLGYVVSTGQSLLGDNKSDYSRLSLPLQQIAQGGVRAISWNTSSSSVTLPPDTTPTQTGTTPTNPGTGPGITPVVVPSNVFSITSGKAKGTALTVALKLPGAGQLKVLATTKYKGKTLTYTSVASTVQGGTGSVTLKPGSKAKSALKKVTSLKISVKVTFTPTGGAAASQSKTITVKGSKKPAKKHAKKKPAKKKKH